MTDDSTNVVKKVVIVHDETGIPAIQFTQGDTTGAVEVELLHAVPVGPQPGAIGGRRTISVEDVRAAMDDISTPVCAS